ncbi:MAG: hypothetical protein R2839_08180 [Thermomicrobiales bacterium]
MLIGYVSDENYVAIADCAIELDQNGVTAATTRSTARGAIHVDVPPGDYRVTLVKSGFGSKSVKLSLPLDKPHQFRLLSDCLLGHVWPKWVRTGEKSEFRVHSVEPYQLSLWRYGLKKEFIRYLGVFDEHGPRAVMQITPDGDYTQTGIKWNQIGYTNPHHTQFVVGPERSGLYYLRQDRDPLLFVSLGGGAGQTEGRYRRRARYKQLECVQQFRRPKQLCEFGRIATHSDCQRQT